MRYLLMLYFCVLCSVGFSQNSIRGKVVHETSGEPIANASVFVNSSTRGTISKTDGSFELNNVPAGNHELIISSVGFITLVMPYTAADLPLNLEIRLKPKAAELATVIVEPDEKDGWNRFGKFFMDSFIGTTSNAKDCKLRNPEVLRFRYSKKNNMLRVIADEPLIIENRALGYSIQYQLEEFSFDYRSKFLLFMGYALFEDIPTNRDGLKRRWAANREEAWHGSIQHFMRSLYRDSLASEGFEVKRLIKTINAEKARLREVTQAKIRAQRAAARGGPVVIHHGDSTEYYNRIMRQPDEFDAILPGILTADSLLTGEGPEKNFFFTNYLYITYKKEREEKGYVEQSFEKRAPFHQRSTVFLPNLSPLVVDAKGNFSPIQDLVSYGYWAWSEKISTMLPLDYADRFD
ncbi:MAG TPA: carboxypeptidase-like regulatory domain-containing protein [Chitinophagaceae bacterium]|nr:carboxypeptidase-like regulatory domain-containing protein [Chitinophagaceae bacterium]